MRLLPVAAALAACTLCACRPALEAAEDACREQVRVTVLSMVDGDTADVRIDEGDLEGTEERVRLIGVDTPEVDHSGDDHDCYGLQAWEASRDFIEGQSAWLTFDVACEDAYQRTLGYLWRASDRSLMNGWLIEQGHGRACPFGATSLFEERFDALQEEAQLARRGLWADCAQAGGCWGG